MTHNKRGAPLGNHNALKHGFYSSAFKARERRLLNQVPSTDLTGEIQLIRIANYRFLQAFNSTASPLDVHTQLAALRAVNLSAVSIASLSRAQSLTYVKPGEPEPPLDAPPEGSQADSPDRK